MNKLIRFNSKGFTLIEVLASLVILTILMGLLMSALTNSMEHFNISKKKITLSQQANLVLSEITNLHQSKSSYTLSFESAPENTFKINGKLASEENIIFDVKAGQVDYDILNGTLTVNTQKPLFIDLTLTDTSTSQKYSVKTVINRY